MRSYEVHCRPLGRPDLPACMVFTLEGPDHRFVARRAAQRCFEGGRVSGCDGEDRWLDPRRWTVCRVRPVAEAGEGTDADDEADDWPRPDRAFANPATREAAIASVYAGRRYENLPIRRSRTVLAFANNGRPVPLRLV